MIFGLIEQWLTINDQIKKMCQPANCMVMCSFISKSKVFSIFQDLCEIKIGIPVWSVSGEGKDSQYSVEKPSRCGLGHAAQSAAVVDSYNKNKTFIY